MQARSQHQEAPAEPKELDTEFDDAMGWSGTTEDFQSTPEACVQHVGGAGLSS